MRVAYNHEIINIIREKEIKELKEEIKDINISFKEKIKMNNDVKKKFKKRDLKNMSIGRALSIINGPQTAENEKKLDISEKEKNRFNFQNNSMGISFVKLIHLQYKN